MKTIPEASTLAGWRKSSYSNGEGGECVEIIDSFPDAVPVRDSKDPHGPALAFRIDGWSSFIDAVKGGNLAS